jgi:hypothetical protein
MEATKFTKHRLCRYTQEQIAGYVKQWKESGLSKKAFCLSSNINYYTFGGWTVPKKKKKKIPTSGSGFIPVKVKEVTAFPFAEVHYANGSRIVLREAVGAKFLREMMK